MEWVKLIAVPAYYHDGALLRAGEAAEVLFCRGLAHCGSVESAGVIDKTVIPLLVPTRPQARADALVREGLWLDEGTHYRVRSWDKWQDQHDAAAERRRKDRERQREHRRKAREDEKRDGHKDESRDSHSDSPRDTRDGHGVDVERDVEKNSPRPPAADTPPGFAEFWLAYPRKVSKGQALRAYKTALKKATPEALLAGARRYAKEREGQDQQFTKHASSWLNALGWEDVDTTPPPTHPHNEWVKYG